MKNWYFYYETQDSIEISFGTQMCKRPQSTKRWKELQSMLDRDEATKIGYKIFN